MFKDLFRFSFERNDDAHEAPRSATDADRTEAIVDLAEALERSSAEGFT